VSVPGAGYKLKFVPIPGDKARGVEPFWMCTTELPWDAYDAFAYKLDEPEENRAAIDAKTHPSKPYLPPDRGFGHAGYATISVTHKSAEAFCTWLSGKTGMTFRLATEDEWEVATLAGRPATPPAPAPPAAPGGAAQTPAPTGPFGFEGGVEKLGEYAWFKDNAAGTPHPIATKKPNAFGVYDLHGNVAEWVNGRDGKPVVKGGSYVEPAENLVTTWRSLQQPSWNSSDPQVPKSRWWLSDGPFIGFRVVRVTQK
jgi:formylglycine-generating enzyme required for sulfatase activity